MVVKQPKFTRVEEPTLLCNQLGRTVFFSTERPQITGPTTLDPKQIRANMKQMDSACRLDQERKMEREKFVKLVEEALGALPTKFRKRIQNVAVLVENVPPRQLPRRGSRNAGIIDSDDAENLVLGVFEGGPTTVLRVFDLPSGSRPHRALSEEH